MTDDRDRDDIRAEFVRRLVLERAPELSADEIAAAFASQALDANASVMAEIADAAAGAITALEERLSELKRGAPRRAR
jgi:hypothetical protein